MNKILLIIKREYLSRVKKKSFLLVTFLVPLFLIGVYALTIYLTAKSFESNDATVYMVDQSGLFANKRSEEHTSELKSLMRISYAFFCFKKKKTETNEH